MEFQGPALDLGRTNDNSVLALISVLTLILILVLKEVLSYILVKSVLGPLQCIIDHAMQCMRRVHGELDVVAGWKEAGPIVVCNHSSHTGGPC